MQLWQWQFGVDAPHIVDAPELAPLDFFDIDGWADDDHAQAFRAFCQSLDVLEPGTDIDAARLHALRLAALELGKQPATEPCRRFFETHFTAFRVLPPDENGLVTGYFEPELSASLEANAAFSVPVYALPDDLVLIGDDDKRDRPDLAELTAARSTPHGPVPYETREDIERGALQGRGLELAWLADPFEAFVMHVQGSATLRFPDGSAKHFGFAGKNGYPYTSIGRLLLERGELDPSNASLDALLDWLRADRERGRELIRANRSYIFFRQLGPRQPGEGPEGALGAPLTPGRSLAVDPRCHQLGLPIWVSASGLPDTAGSPFNRLMIAQDTGSAIRGFVRGDIFWGSGDEAGHRAGRTKHPCQFCILIPN